MAIAIRSTISTVLPAYSPIVVDARDSTAGITRYDIIVDVNGSDDIEYSVLPEPDDGFRLNLSTILSRLFTSEVFYHTSNEQTFTNGLKSYTVTIRSFIGDTPSDVEVLPTKYVFNAVDNSQSFDFENYRGRVGQTVQFLTDWQGEIPALSTQRFTLQYFDGTFGTDSATIPSLNLERFDKTGTSLSTTPLNLGSSNSTPKIKSISFVINGNVGDTFVISNTTNRVTPITYRIVRDTSRGSATRFAWVNNLGGTEYFTFIGNIHNTIEIDRDTYSRRLNNINQLAYNAPTVQDNFSASSGFIDGELASNIKWLWFSPRAATIENNTSRAILIDARNVEVFSRRGSSSRFYGLDFRYENDFIIQTQ